MPKRRRKNEQFARDLSKPLFDVAILGTEEDPCFGKLYSLTAPECLECGDIEACAAVFAQKQTQKRLKLEEKENTNLDVEIDKLETNRDIEQYVRKLHKKGKPLTVIKALVRKRFKININPKTILYGHS